MKIAALYSTNTPNANYRVLAPLRELERRGHQIVVSEVDDRGRFATDRVAGADLIHVYRWYDKTLARFVEAERRRGVAITWDNDDDPRLIPPESPLYNELGGLRSAREFNLQVAMMTRAHVVTTTTEVLAERYRGACDGEVRVIENYLLAEQVSSGRRRGDGVVIGWVAALEHRAEARRLQLTDVLRRVMERVPSVRVVTVGVRLNLDPNRYEHHLQIPFQGLPSIVRHFDIGIAPLSDIPMSSARSNVKVKEYSAVGVPWAASARGPYVGLGEREGGVLVQDDEWEEVLVKLASSRHRRRQLHRRARAWGRSQVIARHVDVWEAAFNSAVRHAKQMAA